MAVTFINYNDDNGFYVHEDFMQLAFMYISHELKNHAYEFDKAEAILRDCESKVNGIHSGYFVLDWKNELNGKLEENEMVRLLENIILELNRKPFIEVSELQSMVTEDEHWKGVMDRRFPTRELNKIFGALIKLIEGNWNSKNYAMEIVW